jgi:rubrerythrin
MKTEEYQKIIANAIEREVEAYAFYRTVSEKVKDSALKAIFTELAGEETKHRTYLQAILTKGKGAMHFSESVNYRVTDSSVSPALTPDMKPLDGLVLAIKKELDAMQMYSQLANANTDPEQKMIFQQLAAMEKGHKARLEDIYTNMAFPEVW